MIITAPKKEFNFKNVSVFLAGTIDNGSSVDWQESVAQVLQVTYPELDIYNPRRNKWNPEADVTELREQIQWELEYLQRASIVFFNFLEDSKSPVTMLELGIALANNKSCVVVNPPGFYRHENIRTTCVEFGRVPQTSLDKGLHKLMDKLDSLYS